MEAQKSPSPRCQSNCRYGEDFSNHSGDKILIQSINAPTALNKPARTDDIKYAIDSGLNSPYNDNHIDQGNTKLEKKYKIPYTLGPIVKSRDSAAIFHSLNINDSQKMKILTHIHECSPQKTKIPTHIHECSPKDTPIQNDQIKNHYSGYTTNKNVYPYGTHEITSSERAPSIPESKVNGIYMQTKNYPVVKKKDIYSNNPLYTKKENSKILGKSRKRTFAIFLKNFLSDFWQKPHSRIRRRHLLDVF